MNNKDYLWEARASATDSPESSFGVYESFDRASKQAFDCIYGGFDKASVVAINLTTGEAQETVLTYTRVVINELNRAMAKVTPAK